MVYWVIWRFSLWKKRTTRKREGEIIREIGSLNRIIPGSREDNENKEYSKHYYEKNKEKIQEYNKEYSKQYYEKNKEKIQEYYKEYSKQYHEKNKEKLQEHKKCNKHKNLSQQISEINL